MRALSEWLSGTPYHGYAYSYPHKSAYRLIEPSMLLRDVWADEDQSSLFLYMHVPYCEQRCGFCNLFTLSKPGADGPARYLDALERQARVTRAVLPDARFARVAIGGGTPSYLSGPQLSRLFDVAEHIMGADMRAVPTGIEVSPETLTKDKLRRMVERGVDRVSIGIQSFVHSETRTLGRAQDPEQARHSLDLIREAGVKEINLDLIYGARGQTPESWRYSVTEALRFEPEEIYLYPLYVRALTGLGRSTKRWDDSRLALYRTGRDLLLDAGYTQVSMRMFRKPMAMGSSCIAPPYRCQSDGMVGLGPGARSYTRELHYSCDFAVGRSGVAAILNDFNAREEKRFAEVAYGIALDDHEQLRRDAILSILSDDGLAYERFAPCLPIIDELRAEGLAELQDGILKLNARGIERSDVIGPWLYSDRVNRLSADAEPLR